MGAAAVKRREAEEVEARREAEAEEAATQKMMEEAEEAEAAVQEAETAEKVALLISMGFSDEEVAGALEATKGSLERAADWLFQNRVMEPVVVEPAFPEEWVETLEDLVEMGFEETMATEVLQEVDGDFKQAVKLMVQSERNTP